MRDEKLTPRLDAIRAIEERFLFERSVREDIEKTKTILAHPGWVKIIANMPIPEIPKIELEEQKPITKLKKE